MDLDALLNKSLEDVRKENTQQEETSKDELEALLRGALQDVRKRKSHYKGALLLQPQTKDLDPERLEQMVESLFDEEERRRKVQEEVEGVRDKSTFFSDAILHALLPGTALIDPIKKAITGGKEPDKKGSSFLDTGKAWLSGALKTVARAATSAEMTPSKVIAEEEARIGVEKPFSLEKGLGTTVNAVVSAIKGDFSKFKDISFIEEESARAKLQRVYDTPIIDENGRVNLESLYYSSLPREEQNRLLVLWAMQKTGINDRRPFEEILKAGGGYLEDASKIEKAARLAGQSIDASTFNILSSQLFVKGFSKKAIDAIIGENKEVKRRRGEGLLYSRQLTVQDGVTYLIDEELGAIPIDKAANREELAEKVWEAYAARVVGTVQTGGQVALAQALDALTIATLGGSSALAKGGGTAVKALSKIDDAILLANASEKMVKGLKTVSPSIGNAVQKALMADTKRAAIARTLIDASARMTALGTLGALGGAYGQETESAVGNMLVGQTFHSAGALVGKVLADKYGVNAVDAALKYDTLVDIPKAERDAVIEAMKRGGYAVDEGGYQSFKDLARRTVRDMDVVKKYAENMKGSKITPQLAYEVINAIASDKQFQEEFLNISAIMSSDGRNLLAKHFDESARKAIEEIRYFIGQSTGKEAGTAKHMPRIYAQQKMLEEAEKALKDLSVEIKNSREKTIEWLQTTNSISRELADNILNVYTSQDFNTLFFRPAVHEFARMLLQEEYAKNADATAVNTGLYAMAVEAGGAPIRQVDMDAFKKSLEALSSFKIYNEGEPLAASILRRAEKIEQQDTAPGRTAAAIRQKIEETSAQIKSLIQMREQARAKAQYHIVDSINKDIEDLVSASPLTQILEKGREITRDYTAATGLIKHYAHITDEQLESIRSGTTERHRRLVKNIVNGLLDEEYLSRAKDAEKELISRKEELLAEIERIRTKEKERIDKRLATLSEELEAKQKEKRDYETAKTELENKIKEIDSKVAELDALYTELHNTEERIKQLHSEQLQLKEAKKTAKQREKELKIAIKERDKAEGAYKKEKETGQEGLRLVAEEGEYNKKLQEIKKEIEQLQKLQESAIAKQAQHKENESKYLAKLERINKKREKLKQKHEEYVKYIKSLDAEKLKETQEFKQQLASNSGYTDALEKIKDIQEKLQVKELDSKTQKSLKLSLANTRRKIQKIEEAELQNLMQRIETGDVRSPHLDALEKLNASEEKLKAKIESLPSKVPVKLLEEAIKEREATLKALKRKEKLYTEKADKEKEDILAAALNKYRAAYGEKLAEEMRLHREIGKRVIPENKIKELQMLQSAEKRLKKEVQEKHNKLLKEYEKRDTLVAKLASLENMGEKIAQEIERKKKEIMYTELFGRNAEAGAALIEQVKDIDRSLHMLNKESMAKYREKTAERIKALYEDNQLTILTSIPDESFNIRIDNLTPFMAKYLGDVPGVAGIFYEINKRINNPQIGYEYKPLIEPDIIAFFKYLASEDGQKSFVRPYVESKYEARHTDFVATNIKREAESLSKILLNFTTDREVLQKCIRDLEVAINELEPKRINVVAAIEKIEYLRDKYFISEMLSDERAANGHYAFLENLYNKMQQGRAIFTSEDIVKLQNVVKDSALGKAFRMHLETTGERPEWFVNYKEELVRAYNAFNAAEPKIIKRIVDEKVADFVRYGILNSPDEFNAKVALGYFLNKNLAAGVSFGKTVELLQYAEAAHLRRNSKISWLEPRDIKALNLERNFGFRIAQAHRGIFGAINMANNRKIRMQETFLDRVRGIKIADIDNEGKPVTLNYTDCMYVGHPVQQLMLKSVVAVRGHDNMPTIFTDFLRTGFHDGMTFIKMRAENIRSGLAPELTKEYEVGYLTTHLVANGELTAMGKLYLDWLRTKEDATTFANRIVKDLRSSMDEAIHVPGVREEIEIQRNNLRNFIAYTLDFYGKQSPVNGRMALEVVKVLQKLDAEWLQEVNKVIAEINGKHGLSIPVIKHNPWRLDTEVTTAGAHIVMDISNANNWRSIDSWMGNRYRTSPEGQTLKSLTYNLEPHYITDLAEEVIIGRHSRLYTEYLQKPYTLQIQNAARYLEETGYATISTELEQFFVNPSTIVPRNIYHNFESWLKQTDNNKLSFLLGVIGRLTNNAMGTLVSLPNMLFLQPAQSAIQMLQNRPTRHAFSFLFNSMVSGLQNIKDGLPLFRFSLTSLRSVAPDTLPPIAANIVHAEYTNRSSPYAETFFTKFAKVTGYEKVMNALSPLFLPRVLLHTLKEKSEAAYIYNAIKIGKQFFAEVTGLPEEQWYSAIRKELGAYATQGDALSIVEDLRKGNKLDAEVKFLRAYVSANLGNWGSEVELPIVARWMSRLIPGSATFYQAATINIMRSLEAVRNMVSSYSNTDEAIYSAIALMSTIGLSVGIGALSRYTGIDMLHSIAPINAISTYVSDEEVDEKTLTSIIERTQLVPTRTGLQFTALINALNSILSATSDAVMADDPEMQGVADLDKIWKEGELKRKLYTALLTLSPVSPVPRSLGLSPREFIEMFFSGLVMDIDALDRAKVMESVILSVNRTAKELKMEQMAGNIEELSTAHKVIDAWKNMYISFLAHPEELKTLIDDAMKIAVTIGETDEQEVRKMLLSRLRANPHFSRYYESVREAITASKKRKKLEEAIEAGELTIDKKSKE